MDKGRRCRQEEVSANGRAAGRGMENMADGQSMRGKTQGLVKERECVSEGGACFVTWALAPAGCPLPRWPRPLLMWPCGPVPDGRNSECPPLPSTSPLLQAQALSGLVNPQSGRLSVIIPATAAQEAGQVGPWRKELTQVDVCRMWPLSSLPGPVPEAPPFCTAVLSPILPAL